KLFGGLDEATVGRIIELRGGQFWVCVCAGVYIVISVGRDDIITVVKAGEDLDKGDQARPVVLPLHVYEGGSFQELCAYGVPVVGMDDLAAYAVESPGAWLETALIRGGPGGVMRGLHIAAIVVIGGIEGSGIIIPPLG